jgi:diadenosine tetraphosphate (Ap4A) HIT family hydrolase
MLNYVNEKIVADGCPGCAYARHEFSLPCGIAYENEKFILSQDWELPIVGFMVLSPKRHIDKLEELSSDERNEMFDLVNKTIIILRNNKICDRFDIIFEEKERKHFHIWIMPRHEWMSNLVDDIINNIGDVFEYAKNNYRNDEVFKEINNVTNILRKELVEC